MAQDRTSSAGQDRQRINLNEDYEVRDWSKKFGVSADELKQAVNAVGNEASKVEEYFAARKK